MYTICPLPYTICSLYTLSVSPYVLYVPTYTRVGDFTKREMQLLLNLALKSDAWRTQKIIPFVTITVGWVGHE